jgi:ATP-binding cassette subfamily F protein uup
MTSSSHASARRPSEDAVGRRTQSPAAGAIADTTGQCPHPSTEPTNDLDLETLTVLEAERRTFPGTVLIVSHDRVFLENVVTSTWLFTGDGRIEEHVGTNFGQWTERPSRPPRPCPSSDCKAHEPKGPGRDEEETLVLEQREFDALPGRIEALERKSEHCRRESPPQISTSNRAADIKAALDRVEKIARETAEHARALERNR